MEYQFSMSHWPRESLLAKHAALDIGCFLTPFKIVEFGHEVIQNLKIVIAREHCLERGFNNTVSNYTSIRVSILLLVKGSFVRLVMIFIPAICLFIALLEVADDVVQIYEQFLVELCILYFFKSQEVNDTLRLSSQTVS